MCNGRADPVCAVGRRSAGGVPARLDIMCACLLAPRVASIHLHSIARSNTPPVPAARQGGAKGGKLAGTRPADPRRPLASRHRPASGTQRCDRRVQHVAGASSVRSELWAPAERAGGGAGARDALRGPSVPPSALRADVSAWPLIPRLTATMQAMSITLRGPLGPSTSPRRARLLTGAHPTPGPLPPGRLAGPVAGLPCRVP